MYRLLLSLVIVTVCVHAQVSTGTIVGTVQDASSAVVVNAKVSLRHLATAEIREVFTNERGEFNAAFLRIGDSSVTVEMQGFRSTTVASITVRVDQTVDLPLQLEIGSVAETVHVTAATPLVDSATSSVGQVIENKKIVDLPLNGRNTFALGLVAGNTIPVSGMGTNLPFVAGGAPTRPTT